MKLADELKRKIDTYFESISPQEFYDLLITKYGFTEDDFEYEFSELYDIAETEQYGIDCYNKYLPQTA